MKILTINLNGIRSASKKGFFEWLAQRPELDACMFQEIKCEQAEANAFDGALRAMGFRHVQWHAAAKKGYAGTGLCSRAIPDEFGVGFGSPEFDDEGRLCHARFGELFLSSAYFPSGSAGEHRQASKLRFLEQFSPWILSRQNSHKHCLIAADLNIASQNIDLKNWKGNIEAPGCTSIEREWMRRWLSGGWSDCARDVRPNDEFYTWWSPRAGSRQRNVGWRIDAQIATQELGALARHAEAPMLPQFSDHAPLIVDYQADFADLCGK